MKQCGTCRFFVKGGSYTVLDLSSDCYKNPDKVCGECNWVNPVPLPFWLWKNFTPTPVDGKTCYVWEAIIAREN